MTGKETYLEIDLILLGRNDQFGLLHFHGFLAFLIALFIYKQVLSFLLIWATGGISRQIFWLALLLDINIAAILFVRVLIILHLILI